MLHLSPESQLPDQQPEYLRILQDRFGTPRPGRGHRFSFTDNTTTSACNEGDGDYQESFVGPDNESYSSGKTASRSLLLMSATLAPD